MNRLLSIVIATKDREYYCIEVIKSLLRLNDDRIEICISDNSSTQTIKEFVFNLNRENIEYTYIGENISSIDNFNFAMDLAKGEYITLLGDDDIILPSAIEIVEWAQKNNIDAVSSRNVCTYFWPGSNHDYPNGALIIPAFSNVNKEINDKLELIKLLRGGIVNYMFYDLPKSYHGFVKRTIMMEIKNITGNYYGALSPDIFSVVSISLLSKKHYLVDRPFTIAGVCKKSTTANQIDGTHCGKLEDMPHLQNRKSEYIWDENIPKFYSVTTTWGDSGLNALGAMKYDQYRKYFNMYPLLAQAILMNRNSIFSLALKQTDELRKIKEISFLIFWCRIIISSIYLIYDKIKRQLVNRFIHKNQYFLNIDHIYECVEILKKSNV